ncbi:DedA family protein [Sphingomonas carotinifaciens]|uniref:Membrane protein DedA, SNARE-associated domain n=1 Tax=Sphingomonas carotinifaciens TaxID=1166323 RepID=A0A1G7S1D0_9SPHN|nr:DedA family protein [Sphingomonas carotinifaciens]MBB4088172.1 membrane protein DedA with SNARE-associated domain [Sphingomonas carotinifaciens]SDG16269.1 membrane protein DedA, SNARE-associated domain [Sphingomonas carotinifaciens]
MADGDRKLSIEAIVARWGVAAIGLGAGLEGETAVIAGGLLAHQGLVSLPGAMAAAAAGSFVADQAFFAAGRRFREVRWVRRLRESKVYGRVMGMLERHPIGFIFAFRFLYGLRTISPVAIGTSTVPARLFLGVNLAAACLWGATFTAIGYLFGEGLTELLGRWRPRAVHVLAAAALVIVAGAIGWWWRRRQAQGEGEA